MVKFALIGDPQYALREPVEGRYYHLAAGNLKRTLKILDSAELDFVVNLGDLGDGQSRDEIPELLDRYRSSRHAIRHVVGNHDFVQYSHEELLRLLGLAGFFYDFSVKGVRFIVLNGLDVSRFSPPKSRNYREAVKYRERNIFRNLRDWDGMLSEEGFAFLRDRLDRSLAASESAVILCHVPLYSGASGSGAVMWDSARILELLDRYPHVRAVFAGHYHPGGAAVRKGVVHKTVKAICNCMEPTALIARIDGDEITFEPVGEEKAFSYSRSDCASAAVSGRALPESVIMSNTGELAVCDREGNFRMALPAGGVYCLKAMKDGFADSFRPMLRVPARGVEFSQAADSRRHLVRGHFAGPAALKIADCDQPVHFFDLRGNPYGAAETPPGTWNERNAFYWTRGEYAFTATGRTEVTPAFPDFPEIRRAGWFKGDFHAHIIHAENTYCGNLQMSAALAKMEHYDWIYFSSDYANDGDVADYHALAEHLSEPGFLLRVNSEFPKNHYGHVGNIGIGPVTDDFDCEKISNFELAEEYIYNRGGVAIPVHPLFDDGIRTSPDGRQYSWMSGKEVMLWLLCKPELLPVLDLFYFDDTPQSESFWYMLLDRGYRIGCCATSDAAFDVGRTPGCGRGATYVKLDALNEKSIVAGFNARRTMASFDGCCLLYQLHFSRPLGGFFSALISPCGIGLCAKLRFSAVLEKGSETPGFLSLSLFSRRTGGRVLLSLQRHKCLVRFNLKRYILRAVFSLRLPPILIPCRKRNAVRANPPGIRC